MTVLNQELQNYIVNKVGMGGIDSYDDPKDIADNQCTDMLNVVFDNGFVSPRPGSVQYAPKPTGETSQPFQFLIPTTSIGVEYMIVNYGLNFYLRYMGFWMKLNQTYTPPTAGLFYGSTSWNAGIDSDVFYFGNGTDDSMKWIMATGVTIDPFIGNASPYLTMSMEDGNKFPDSGDVVMVDPVTGDTYVLNFSSNNGAGSLTVNTNNVGDQTIPPGMLVAMQIQDLPSGDGGFPKGKIFNTFQGRLLISNSVGAENTINYSYLDEPEVFTVDSTPDSGGFYTIITGSGGIVNIDNFGAFLVVEKVDELISFSFQYASDNSGFIISAPTIMAGDSIGPVSNANTVNYMNTLYYITQTEGIVQFSPVVTGTQTSPTLTVLSQNIQNYVTQILNFTNGRATGFNQKLFWIDAVPLLTGVSNTINNGVIMYDLLRQSWTRFDNWNAADMKPVNEVLYYASLNDGAIYQCLVINTYQDVQEGNQIAYNVSFTTKRFDLGSPQLLSKGQYAYIQGYINLTTTFFVDVMYDENGYLGLQTYEIDGTNSTIVQNNLLGGLAAYPLAIPLLGGFNLETMQIEEQPAFFRCYLEMSQAYRYNNVQLRFYSQEIGAYWGVNNITLMTYQQTDIPTQLVLGPTLTPPIII